MKYNHFVLDFCFRLGDILIVLGNLVQYLK